MKEIHVAPALALTLILLLMISTLGYFTLPRVSAAAPIVISSDTTILGVAGGETVIINQGVEVGLFGYVEGTVINNGKITSFEFVVLNEGLLVNNGVIIADNFGARDGGVLFNNETGTIVQFYHLGMGLGGGQLINSGLVSINDHASTQPSRNATHEFVPILNNTETGILSGGFWHSHGLEGTNEGIISFRFCCITESARPGVILYATIFVDCQQSQLLPKYHFSIWQ